MGGSGANGLIKNESNIGYIFFKKLEVSNGKYNSAEKIPRNCKVVSHTFPSMQDCICLHIAAC